MKFVFFFMIAINLISFVIMGRDKQLAKNREWRISESTLWFLAFIGGAIGGTLGMYYFRHKTKHFVFKFGFPLLAIMQIAVWTLFL